MLKVGLTGGIACGKTVVRKRFEDLGARTLDADAVVHDLFQTGGPVPLRLAEVFGSGVLTGEGAVDRKALGKIAFDDERARERLNEIVHPEVFRAIESFFEQAGRDGDVLAMVDAALMIETGSYRRYDRLLVVYCTREIQLARLMARDGLSRAEAEKRLAAQMDAAEKKRYADFSIDTSGELSDTLARVDELWPVLQEAARTGG